MQPFQCTRAGISSSSASLRPTTNAANFTRRSYGQNRLSLMMSRKLTSGFNFRSCDHHHMAVMPMSIKFSENSRSHPRFPDCCRPSLDLCIRTYLSNLVRIGRSLLELFQKHCFFRLPKSLREMSTPPKLIKEYGPLLPLLPPLPLSLSHYNID